MKKLMLIAAAFATLISCTKTQVIQEETPLQEISMKACNQAAVKATGPVSGTTLTATDETMTVYGYYANDGDSYANTAYMEGVLYGYNSTNSNWWGVDNNGTHTPYYWPSTGYMKFIAVYPTAYPKATGSSNKINSTRNTNTTTTNIPDIDLSTQNYQKDIMYSNNLHLTSVECSSSQSKQNLIFYHLLSQVVVNVTNNHTSEITNVTTELLNANTNGDISIVETDPNAPATDPTTNITYTIEGQTSSFTVNNNNTFLVLPVDKPTTETDYTPLADATNTVVDYTTNSITKTTPSLKITYTLNNNQIIYTKELDDWQPGKKYTYNLSFGLTEITFNATVIDWFDTNTTDSTI